MEIFRRKKYLVECSRGFVGRNRLNARKPKSLGPKSGILKLSAEVQCALLRRRYRNHTEIADAVALPMFSLRVVRDKRMHLAHEVGLLLLIFALAGAESARKHRSKRDC